MKMEVAARVAMLEQRCSSFGSVPIAVTHFNGRLVRSSSGYQMHWIQDGLYHGQS